MNATKSFNSMWIFACAAGLISLLAGAWLSDGLEVAGIAIGVALALAHVFMLKSMAAKALEHNKTGKSLILIIFLKSMLRFLLTALFLAILFYLGWLKPLGFVIGFTAVMLAVFVWGCGKLLLGARNPL